jgi:hypothetical protein
MIRSVFARPARNRIRRTREDKILDAVILAAVREIAGVIL